VLYGFLYCVGGYLPFIGPSLGLDWDVDYHDIPGQGMDELFLYMMYIE
jgi:hypothetical protein